MKKCKVVHLHSGEEHVIKSNDNKLVEDYPWIEEILNKYLAEGYEVKHVVSNYTPAIQEEGCFSFYIGGFTFFLEKEE